MVVICAADAWEVFNTTGYIIGGAVGLLYGGLVAFLNSRMTAHYLKKQKEEHSGNLLGVMAMSFGRLLIAAAALFIVFLLRNWLPWPLNAVLLGTALGLTVVSFVIIGCLTKKYQDS